MNYTKLLLLSIILVFSFAAGLVRAEVMDEISRAIESYAVKHNPEWEGADLKISLGNTERLIETYRGRKVEFKVPEDFKLTKVTPRLSVPIAVIEEGYEKERVVVRARLEVFREIVVASRKILKKQLLSKADLEIKKREVSLYPNKYFVDKNRVIGKISTTLIPEGAILLQWMVKEQPVVSRGDALKIVIRSEGLLVEARGEALEDGQIGDIIKVRRKGVKQSIAAEITGPGQVEVKI